MKCKKFLLVFMMSIFPLSTYADEDRSIKIDLGAGLTSGGDTIGSLIYKDGSKSDIKTGQLVHLYAGLLFDPPGQSFSFRTAIGYHVDDASAKNGSVTFDRIPLDIIPFYKFNAQNRLGMGITYHLNPKLSGDFDVGEWKFKNALGLVLEYGYGFGVDQKVWLGVRYVSIDYKIKEINNIPVSRESYDGSHLGIYVQTAL